MFIISLTYKKPMEEVDRYIEEHVNFLDKYYLAGNFIFSGRKNPRVGGVILAYNLTRSEWEELVKEDPSCQNQIADYEITEVIPAKCTKAFEPFVQGMLRG